ncbi:MAG TPA: SRPBCC domain-containing protein [Phycisphaerales bacterium]|nr:SRPBCC domain-containing protein [Phycisphaerales bacterium]
MPSAVTVEQQSETKAKFRVMIRGSIDAVWREITRTDAPIAAFFNSRMHASGPLGPGARIAMRTPDGKNTGVVGEILEFSPPRRFAHTFKFTSCDDPECKVIYELEPRGDQVQFTLTIEDLPVGTKTAKQMLWGGKFITSTLKSVIETGRPSFGARMFFTLFKIMGPITSKQCRSERWPVN